MFQQNPERRRSGMDRRNLGSMDGGALGIHAIWIPSVYAGIAEEFSEIKYIYEKGMWVGRNHYVQCFHL